MTNRVPVLAVITVLGALALAVVIGGIILAYNDKGLPGELIAIGSAAAGAIGGILSRSDSGSVPVHVTNQPKDPVPVENERGHATDGLLWTLVGALAAVALILWIAERI